MSAFTLDGPVGRLEARQELPAGPLPAQGPRALVVCHPHPQFGGTLQNKVVFSVARAGVTAGLAAVRFNFRGAGDSAGEHDHGRGEVDDVRAALDHAAGLAGGGDGCLALAGFSFGSFVGLSAAVDDPRVAGCLAIAPPVNHYDFGFVRAYERPLTVVYARDDELVPAAAVEAWLAGLVRPPRIVPVAGASHLFHGKLAPLREATASFLAHLA